MRYGLPWIRLGTLQHVRGVQRWAAETLRSLLGSGERIAVTLQTHGPVERYLRAGRYELRPGSPVKALLARAGPLPAGQPLSLLIRGQRVEPSHRLADGDEVVAMQFVAGG